jgi:hypothetical protein
VGVFRRFIHTEKCRGIWILFIQLLVIASESLYLSGFQLNTFYPDPHPEGAIGYLLPTTGYFLPSMIFSGYTIILSYYGYNIVLFSIGVKTKMRGNEEIFPKRLETLTHP